MFYLIYNIFIVFNNEYYMNMKNIYSYYNYTDVLLSFEFCLFVARKFDFVL